MTRKSQNDFTFSGKKYSYDTHVKSCLFIVLVPVYSLYLYLAAVRSHFVHDLNFKRKANSFEELNPSILNGFFRKNIFNFKYYELKYFPINRSYSIIFVIDGLPNLWQSYLIIFFSVNFVPEYLFYTVYEKSIYHSWKC